MGGGWWSSRRGGPGNRLLFGRVGTRPAWGRRTTRSLCGPWLRAEKQTVAAGVSRPIGSDVSRTSRDRDQGRLCRTFVCIRFPALLPCRRAESSGPAACLQSWLRVCKAFRWAIGAPSSNRRRPPTLGETLFVLTTGCISTRRSIGLANPSGRRVGPPSLRPASWSCKSQTPARGEHQGKQVSP